MKKIMLAAALIAATFSAALAERPTKAANDAAMKAGHQAIVTKTSDLESSLKRHDSQAAEAATMDILALMRKGVAQTRYDADMLSGAQHDARYKHMLDMENMVHDFIEYSKDVNANGTKLVQQAKTFLTAY
jgi:hypothetical protein